MPAVISNATRIWELNVSWDIYSQCGVWDPKGRGVDIWECIKARTYISYSFIDHWLTDKFTDDSVPGSQVRGA
jgi:hypothetical protein